MIVSAIISAIAFITIITVTIIITNQTKFFKTDFQTKIRNVVDQINTSQEYTYEFDKRQQQQLTGLEKNVDDVRLTYAKRNELANQLITKRIDAETINGQNISLSGNKGSIQFNSQINGASQSKDYTIQRGETDLLKNHLVIKTPTEKGAALNIMSADGQSKVLIDSSTGDVQIPGNIKANTIQFGDKLKFSSIGNVQGESDWLNMIGTDTNDYKGGLAASKIWTRDNAYLNGNTNINGKATISGKLNISGGTSVRNPNKLQTQFPGTNGENYIRGDTEITGNTNNIGDINIGGNTIIGNSLNVTGNTILNGPTNLIKPVKINHTQTGWQDDSSLSVYSKLGNKGASFGSSTIEGEWSHFPWTDGSTYIRPGQQNKDIIIGDWGAKNVNIGNKDTNVNINGVLNINNSGKIISNGINIQANDTDKGIYSTGQNDFGIYTNGNKKINIDKNGKITNYGNVIAPSIGRDQGDNALFDININQSNNKDSKGTAIHNNLAIADGGGLSVGDFNKKMPEGQVYIRDRLKIRSIPTGNKLNDNSDSSTLNASITSWTDNTGKQAGASFGGPDNWSHFPYTDGNTYIRSGKNKGSILIGDTSTDTVSIGNTDDGSTNINIGRSLQIKDGNTYIHSEQRKDISIGDNMTTNNINLGTKGSTGNVYTKSKIHYIGQEIDATDSWKSSGKTLFAGWNSDTVILGNNKTASSDAISKLPSNSVISANDLYINGESVTSTKICINKTCIDEIDLGNLKKLVKPSTTSETKK